MDAGTAPTRAAQLVIALLLFLLTLPGSVMLMVAAIELPIFLLVPIALVGLLLLVAPSLELAGRHAHILGLASAIVGIALGAWFFLTSPTREPSLLILALFWVPVLVLWSVLTYVRRTAPPAAPDHP